MSLKQITIIDILVLQAGCLITFFLYPHMELIGIGILCFVGSFLAARDTFDWLDKNGGQEMEPLICHVCYRTVGALIGAAFGGVLGFVVAVVILLLGIASLEVSFDVLCFTCLLMATMGGSFLTVGRRISWVTGLVYISVMSG
ncbi:hypothetical protein Pan97_04090 [Bremerella volcania]|uniref:Uncharacterized protein n=1 Tax=Bremerella volcania TaxID=2527984 RepID=A0A518C2J3_9BACT|nr:hypothetical protein Pan97_04090 [Bremerella volcania]